MAAYILTLWPGLEKQQLLHWIHQQQNETKAAISTIIFSGHTNYQELPGPCAYNAHDAGG